MSLSSDNLYTHTKHKLSRFKYALNVKMGKVLQEDEIKNNNKQQNISAIQPT